MQMLHSGGKKSELWDAKHRILVEKSQNSEMQTQNSGGKSNNSEMQKQNSGKKKSEFQDANDEFWEQSQNLRLRPEKILRQDPVCNETQQLMC